MTKLIEQCPNCINPNPAIKIYKGKCGVCGGTGKIEWKNIGIKIK